MDQSAIYCYNHQSPLDIPLVKGFLPVNNYSLAKQALEWVPFLSEALIAGGTTFIDRKD